MLLRSHVSILWLVAEKKVAWDLFFVKSERFLGIALKKDKKIAKTIENDLKNRSMCGIIYPCIRILVMGADYAAG